MGTPNGELFRQEFLNYGDGFGNSNWKFSDVSPIINYIPSSFCSPTENCESPVSVFRYPPTPMSAIECPGDSEELAPLPQVEFEYCGDPPFRFSGPWVDLDTEMQLWRNNSTHPSTQELNFSQSCYYTTHEQLDSGDAYVPERSALDSFKQDSIAKGFDAKRKGMDVGCGSEVLAAKPNKKKQSKRPRITHTPISREDLELHFGKTRDEAASCLGVSVATLKRNARKYGISRWPFNKKSKLPFNAPANLVVGPVLKIAESDQDAPITPKRLAMDTTMGDERSMIVKVKYEAEFIKFELSSLSKMADLEEEISKRLKLKAGSFKIKYLDEDADWVLLPCDVDLEYCMRSLGETTIKMLVLPITST